MNMKESIDKFGKYIESKSEDVIERGKYGWFVHLQREDTCINCRLYKLFHKCFTPKSKRVLKERKSNSEVPEMKASLCVQEIKRSKWGLITVSGKNKRTELDDHRKLHGLWLKDFILLYFKREF